MKTIITSILILGLSATGYSQADTVIVDDGSENLPDTTKFKMGGKEIIIIDKSGDDDNFEDEFKEGFGDEEPKKFKSEPHWAGVDFGFTMLMNNNFENNFPSHQYWENDAARSQVWNLNLLLKHSRNP